MGIGTIFSIVLFYFFYMVIIEKQSLSVNTSDWGNFGSYFGGISGPILSFLAFIILAKTFSIQQSMSDAQENEHKRQRKLSELELCNKNLERLEAQLDLLLNKKANTLNNKTIMEVIGISIDKIERDNPNVENAAKAAINNLVFISYYVADIEKKMKDLYPEDNGFSMLSFKQYWILKYNNLAKNCLSIISNDVLSKQERQYLSDGLGVE